MRRGAKGGWVMGNVSTGERIRIAAPSLNNPEVEVLERAGVWVVHATTGAGDRFTVTHAPSGFSCGTYDSEKATRIKARWLGEHFPAWCASTPFGVLTDESGATKMTAAWKASEARKQAEAAEVDDAREHARGLCAGKKLWVVTVTRTVAVLAADEEDAQDIAAEEAANLFIDADAQARPARKGEAPPAGMDASDFVAHEGRGDVSWEDAMAATLGQEVPHG